MYNIYEEKEFLSLKMFSFIGHGYDLASFQCYLYNRDMFFKTFYWTAKMFQNFVYIWRIMKNEITNFQLICICLYLNICFRAEDENMLMINDA